MDINNEKKKVIQFDEKCQLFQNWNAMKNYVVYSAYIKSLQSITEFKLIVECLLLMEIIKRKLYLFLVLSVKLKLLIGKYLLVFFFYLILYIFIEFLIKNHRNLVNTHSDNIYCVHL